MFNLHKLLSKQRNCAHFTVDHDRDICSTKLIQLLAQNHCFTTLYIENTQSYRYHRTKSLF